ncbi:MAG: hypothetical protein F6K24_37720 [Okeania sp. SIO2D1]|nr:hypothetical protein [Okeania sp. SIO2D1]
MTTTCSSDAPIISRTSILLVRKYQESAIACLLGRYSGDRYSFAEKGNRIVL